MDSDTGCVLDLSPTRNATRLAAQIAFAAGQGQHPGTLARIESLLAERFAVKLCLGETLRNIFDQYAQPENRVTHALLTALNEDRALLALFLKELVGVEAAAPAALSVLEQQFPGETELAEEDLERRGIPDGWIFDEAGWCVFIESKVTAPFSEAQIDSHRRTAVRRGFTTIQAVAILPRAPQREIPDVRILEWRTVYVWLRKFRATHPWAARAAEYFEIAESRLIETGRFVEGTLTMFAGFPFGSEEGYTYLDAKRILGLAMDELRSNAFLKRLGMNPALPGRPAITGTKDRRVWDFLSLASEGGGTFTKHPHLTLGVHQDDVEAMVTLPHAMNRKARRAIADVGEDGFLQVVQEVLENLRPLLAEHPGIVPWCRGIQRRYPSQRAQPLTDSVIEFDLRTAEGSPGGPKGQPLWLHAAYGAYANRKGANYQLQVGARLPYERCPVLRGAGAVDVIASIWVACAPIIRNTTPSA